MKNNTGISFLVGALVGAGLTWLLTSKEGKEMVEKVKDKGNDLKSTVENELQALKDSLINTPTKSNS